MNTTRHLFVFAAMLALPACSDIAGLGDASDIVGAFVLETVDGDTLPAQGMVYPDLMRSTELLADTIVIHDGAWERSLIIRLGTWGPQGAWTFQTWEQRTSGHTMEAEAGWFVLDAPCDDTGACLPNEIFSVRGDTLFIPLSSDFLFQDLRYIRIPEP